MSPSGKQKIIQAVLEVIAKYKSPVLRSEYAELLASQLQIRASIIYEELKRVTNAQTRGTSYRDARAQQKEVAQEKAQAALLVETAPAVLVHSETELLDLCINNESYAERLINELPVENISQSSVGRILNDLLAHTAQGDWEYARSDFMERVHELECPQLNKALMDPNFPTDKDPRTLDLCFRECVSTIMIYHLKKDQEKLQADINKCLDSDQKRGLRRDFMTLAQNIKRFETNRGQV